MENNMKKSKKVIIWTLILLILALISFNVIYTIFKDQSRLTPNENEWVNSNLNRVLNVSVLNDTNVFGSNGKGVYYDFLNDFSEKYGLQMNSITYNMGESASGIRFGISNTLQDEEVNFYQDHYVLVSKTNDLVLEDNDLKNRKVGILSENATYLKEQLDVLPILTSYPSRNDLENALNHGEVTAILVPRIEYMNTILAKDYRIVAHFTHIARYYNLTLDAGKDAMLSSILNKYFLKWNDEHFDTIFHQQLFQMFVQNLNISQTEIDQLQSIVYNYGFINNSPYEILTGGNYGGIIAAYLQEFSDFSQVEFNFKRFKNYRKLVTAINEDKVNLYFGYQNFTSSGEDITSDILLRYDVLVPEDNVTVVTSLKSLQGETVYVENNSLLSSRLSTATGIQVETYEGEKGLREVIRKKGIIIMDHNMSLYYQKGVLKSYSTRYTGAFATTYVFKAHTNATFIKLFTRYVNFLDENTMNYLGLYNHSVTIRNGTILGTIAKYFLYVFIAFILLIYIIYRSSKRVRIAKKIRREDKMKFIDQMTSLKNRNYLNEHISKWNKNTIYPQTMIVIDLNRIQEINDKIGYEQGDAQIKAAANVLIKMQLDNSDIMRTDGNEFVIYLVGYQTKQITAYIHKLNKEFKNLPYPFGACIGYSMILDDIKSVEDAMNEAIEDVKKQKEMQKEENNG